MTYETIVEEADEILNSVTSLTEREIEDVLDRMYELSEILEKINEDDISEDDTEYQEAAELLEETIHALDIELESRDIDSEEDYY